ncbi:MAG: T9SS type A sorting domain-containing protein [Bacteroidales bacterium]|nr:T9SS type A sorting domain-containing protein [Bacteroidales bacterium]
MKIFTKLLPVIALTALLSVDAFGQQVIYNNANFNPSNSVVSCDLRGRHVDSTLVHLADDFVIPAHESWLIDSVLVTGGYSASTVPADSFMVVFYDDASGAPGTELYRQSFIPTAIATGGNIHCGLTTPLALSTGSYWLSVYAIYQTAPDLSVTRWNWDVGTTPIGSEAMIEDFTGLFGIPPFPWTPLTSLGLTETSCAFKLVGSTNVGIDNKAADAEITVFPNPSSDVINITSSEEIINATLINSMGQVVYTTQVNDDRATIDATLFTTGIYMLTIEIAGGFTTETISIVR